LTENAGDRDSKNEERLHLADPFTLC